MADRLIPDRLRGGSLLDIGCGTYPYFLSRVRFARKLGLERPLADCARRRTLDDVTIVGHDLEQEDRLPFADGSMAVVTMLAVFEHVTPERLQLLLGEIRRVLARGGRYVLTTPPVWTAPILRGMARLGLVSGEEIRDHKTQYAPGAIVRMLARAGFERRAIRYGYFELGMNLWGTADC